MEKEDEGIMDLNGAGKRSPFSALFEGAASQNGIEKKGYLHVSLGDFHFQKTRRLFAWTSLFSLAPRLVNGTLLIHPNQETESRYIKGQVATH